MRRILVVDSSVLIALNSGEKLANQLRRWKADGYEVVIPPAVVEEVVAEPKKFATQIREKFPALANRVEESTSRIEQAIAQQLIRVEAVNYQAYSKVIDNVRKHLSKLDATPEHAIKKGDPEIVALVIQSFNQVGAEVGIASLDKGLLKALKPFNKNIQYKTIKP